MDVALGVGSRPEYTAPKQAEFGDGAGMSFPRRKVAPIGRQGLLEGHRGTAHAAGIDWHPPSSRSVITSSVLPRPFGGLTIGR
jgi:hypothetical protein